MTGKHRSDLPARLGQAARDTINLVSVKVKRRRCGSCYRLIVVPGDHADDCPNMPEVI
jgi:hypothetical protein